MMLGFVASTQSTRSAISESWYRRRSLL